MAPKPKRKGQPFGDRCKAARAAQGFTQAELAERVGVHLITVSRWESAGVVPRGAVLVELASALSVDLRWLMTGETRRAMGQAPEYSPKRASEAP